MVREQFTSITSQKSSLRKSGLKATTLKNPNAKAYEVTEGILSAFGCDNKMYYETYI